MLESVYDENSHSGLELYFLILHLESMHTWQFFVTFLGWLSDPFKRLSDLQLGDKEVALNHLVGNLYDKHQ